MNHRQKLGYTVLGAVIMLVGMGVGLLLTPPLTAQRDGVFDEIRCRTLVVQDKDGKAAVLLAAHEEGNTVSVLDKSEKTTVLLKASEESNGVAVLDKAGNISWSKYSQ